MQTTIALAGNPNSGKTTLFNALTGSRQHVGNYPGVTVEKKSGFCADRGHRFNIVDLPGTYSLTAYSMEEIVARDFLLNEKPAAVVDIVDAANLERNLYLSIQLLEMGLPMLIALNMVDAAERRGIRINEKKLAAVLGVPVIPTIARSGRGKKELLTAAARLVADGDERTPLVISYGHDIDPALRKMERAIRWARFLSDRYPARWVALKYLENDPHIRDVGRKTNAALSNALEAIVKQVADHLKATLATDPEAVIADQRYGYIRAIVGQGIISRAADVERLYLTDRIDGILIHRWIGPLIMAAVLFGLYQFTFTYSEVPVGWMEHLFGTLGALADAHLPDGLLKSLVISGIIDGVGGVLGFVPLILFMFFGIALLEDSGYLARVAFMLDRVFSLFGLHGSSVMAFVLSGGIAGGCAVPGVMATRTLKSPRERLATILTVPFMNCGAKLPVFALLVAVFFSRHEALMMFAITLVSWLGALLVARLLRSTIIRGETTPFVMELPPYRMPTVKGVLLHTWEKTGQYIKKAGTVILGISILLWALMTFPGLSDSRLNTFGSRRAALRAAYPAAVLSEIDDHGNGGIRSAEAAELLRRLSAVDVEQAEAALRHSAAGRIGIALEPVSRLAGFDWRTNIALVGGFAAKEVVVSTLATAYSLGGVNPEDSTPLAARLVVSPGWRPLTALSLILFVIFYAPCMVSVVCISKESGSWRWGAFSVLFNTALAFGIAAAVFQLGTVLGF
jgi:ferrous iron transport protein B